MSDIIPIVEDDSKCAIIGEFNDGLVTLDKPIEYKKLFDVFGNAGIIAIEYTDKGGEMFIKQFRILMWKIKV